MQIGFTNWYTKVLIKNATYVTSVNEKATGVLRTTITNLFICLRYVFKHLTLLYQLPRTFNGDDANANSRENGTLNIPLTTKLH
jgi:hypothetical protein